MSKADEKSRFYFYIDWYNKLMDDFTLKEKGLMLDAICRYFKGEEVEEFKGRVLRKVFTSIKQTMDFNLQRYNEVCEKRKKAGQKGGLANGSKCNQMVANVTKW